jgi:predicted DNA-binding transcriptional regulator AlpA
MTIESLLNETQVAQITGRSVPTLQKDRLRGSGPLFVKIGRLVRYRPVDVDKWIVERVRRSTSMPAIDANVLAEAQK